MAGVEQYWHLMILNGRLVYIPTSVPIALRPFVDPKCFLSLEEVERARKEFDREDAR